MRLGGDSRVPKNGETSSRIDILRFPLIVGVVLIHNYSMTVQTDEGIIGSAHVGFWVDFVRLFVSEGIARTAVPLFFMISGYLFFRGGWSWGKYGSKLKRRINTLLIPFLFWNLATLGAYLFERRIPQARAYVYGSFWLPSNYSSFLSYINALFGITLKYPIAFQFWFIRDLMALVVLAPLVHFLLTPRTALPFLAALFCLWISGIWPFLYPSGDASFFFYLGAYLSRPEKEVEYLDKFGQWLSAAFLFCLILHSAFPFLPYLLKSVIIFGVPSVWWLTGLALRNCKLKSLLAGLSGASFFVFAAHEPLLNTIRKIAFKMLVPASGAAILALYFLIPICLITILVLTYRGLVKATPHFAGIITGNSNRPAGNRSEEH